MIESKIIDIAGRKIKANPSSYSNTYSLKIRNKIFNEKNLPDSFDFILEVFYYSFQTNWFINLSTRVSRNYELKIHKFLLWLQKNKSRSLESCNILNEYNKYRIEVENVRPQSTGVDMILTSLKKGLFNQKLSKRSFNKTESLLIRTKKISIKPRKTVTLTNYFGAINWLKPILGDKWHLLESPRVLVNSFSVTASIALSQIISNKKLIVSRVQENLFKKQFHVKSERDRVTNISRELIKNLKISENEEGKIPADAVDILFSDLIGPKMLDIALDFWRNDVINIPVKIWDPKKSKSFTYYRQPCIFHPDDILRPSKLEELLFSWIMATLMVQPSDIFHLTPSNFLLQKNSKNKVTIIQCVYYKSRSDKKYQTPLVKASSLEGKAILAYLSYFKIGNQKLLTMKNKVFQFSVTGFENLFSRFFRVINVKGVSKAIKVHHEKTKVPQIFIDVIRNVYTDGGKSFGSWHPKGICKGKNLNYSDYVSSVLNPLPRYLFGLSHIKNSSVHAKSDLYRTNDLLNFNSHSSSVEKLYYLTNDNKDWVNQHGRITRMVMHDLEKNVYSLDLVRVNKLINDRISQTKVVEEVNSIAENAYEHLGRHIITGSSISRFVVVDSVESVVYMLHYIDQVEKNYQLLLLYSKERFVHEILPNTEWMYFVIEQKMCPKNVKKGEAEYQKIKSILPNIFNSKIYVDIS